MDTIAVNNLRSVDLNLLVTLEALLTERNVTRAARRLHLSQPSVSVQLRKLRHLFDDPLLVPAPGGLALTARAVATLPALRSTLQDLRRLLNRQDAFDPASARNTWHIGGSDYPQVTVLGPLIERLRRIAPGVSLASWEGGHAKLLAKLDGGAIDLAIMALETLPPHLHHQVLFEERYVLAVRRGHPVLRRRLTPQKLAQLEFVVMSPEGGGFRGVTDAALEGLGYRRRVMVSTQSFLFIPEIVSRTDLAAMLPSRLMSLRCAQLSSVEVPLALPTFAMAMVWHERSQLEPAHVWLRQQLSGH